MLSMFCGLKWVSQFETYKVLPLSWHLLSISSCQSGFSSANCWHCAWTRSPIPSMVPCTSQSFLIANLYKVSFTNFDIMVCTSWNVLLNKWLGKSLYHISLKNGQKFYLNHTSFFILFIQFLDWKDTSQYWYSYINPCFPTHINQLIYFAWHSLVLVIHSQCLLYCFLSHKRKNHDTVETLMWYVL